MKLSIVIPCYNEEKNIPLIYKRLSELDLEGKEIEFVLVDNGSTDNSLQILNELDGKFSFTRLVKVEKNQGYGFGILAGLSECTGEFLGWTHADMQTDPEDILTAFEILKSHNYPSDLFIKGDRKKRPLVDQFFTSGMSIFETILMGVELRDVNAQPNVFHRDFFKSWDNPPHDFSLDLYAFYLAKKQKLKNKRFPVFFHERIHGESNWNTSLKNRWKFIKRTIEFSIELKKRLK